VFVAHLRSAESISLSTCYKCVALLGQRKFIIVFLSSFHSLKYCGTPILIDSEVKDLQESIRKRTDKLPYLKMIEPKNMFYLLDSFLSVAPGFNPVIRCALPFRALALYRWHL